MTQPSSSLLQLSLEQLDTKNHLLQCLAREKLIRALAEVGTQSLNIRDVLTDMAKIITGFFEAEYCLILRFASERELRDCPIQLMVQYAADPSRYLQLEELPQSMIGQLQETTHPTVSLAFCGAMGLQSPLMARVIYRDVFYGMVFMGHFQRTQLWTPLEESIFQEVAIPIATAFYQSDLLLHEHLAKEEARIANGRKSLYLTSVTHELRTPLHNILAGSAMMRDQLLGTLNDKQTEYAELIHQNANHLLTMINELLDYSKIEADKVSLNYEWVVIDDLIQDTVYLVKNLYDSDQKPLNVEISPALPKLISCDPLRVKQILCNFLSNAHLYSTPNTPVALSVHLDGSNIMFLVKDYGPGIEAEDMARIFEPFEQLCPKQGTGLGLSIARKLAECHGGSIFLHSTPGEGSEFVLTLPLMSE